MRQKNKRTATNTKKRRGGANTLRGGNNTGQPQKEALTNESFWDTFFRWDDPEITKQNKTKKTKTKTKTQNQKPKTKNQKTKTKNQKPK